MHYDECWVGIFEHRNGLLGGGGAYCVDGCMMIRPTFFHAHFPTATAF